MIIARLKGCKHLFTPLYTLSLHPPSPFIERWRCCWNIVLLYGQCSFITIVSHKPGCRRWKTAISLADSAELQCAPHVTLERLESEAESLRKQAVQVKQGENLHSHKRNDRAALRPRIYFLVKTLLEVGSVCVSYYVSAFPCLWNTKDILLIFSCGSNTSRLQLCLNRQECVSWLHFDIPQWFKCRL